MLIELEVMYLINGTAPLLVIQAVLAVWRME